MDKCRQQKGGEIRVGAWSPPRNLRRRRTGSWDRKRMSKKWSMVGGCAVSHGPSASHWHQRSLPRCRWPQAARAYVAVWKGRGLRGLLGVFSVHSAPYVQPVPLPSLLQPRYHRKGRPQGLPKFSRIDALPFCALICGSFAELAADGPTRHTSVPVWRQEKAGMKRGSRSPPASPPAPHRASLRDVTLQGWPARSPIMVPLPTMPILLSSDPAIVVKVAKKGQKTKGPEDCGSSGSRETFRGNNWAWQLREVTSGEKVWHLIFW